MGKAVARSPKHHASRRSLSSRHVWIGRGKSNCSDHRLVGGGWVRRAVDCWQSAGFEVYSQVRLHVEAFSDDEGEEVVMDALLRAYLCSLH